MEQSSADMRPELEVEIEIEESAGPERQTPARARIRAWDQRVRDVVHERPVLSVGVALAAGYVFARIVTRR